MKATYICDADCQLCIDAYPNQVGEGCARCLELRTKTVKILDFIKGLFGASAVILFEDETLQTVPISKLKIEEISPF